MTEGSITGFQKLLVEYLVMKDVYGGIPDKVPDTLIIFIPESFYERSQNGSHEEEDINAFVYAKTLTECIGLVRKLTRILITTKDNKIFDGINFFRVTTNPTQDHVVATEIGITNELGKAQHCYQVRLKIAFKEVI